MRYIGTKELSYKIGATEVVLTQLRTIKAAAEVMIMFKLNVLGALWTLVYLIGLGHASDKDKILYSLQRMTDLDTLRVAEIGLM